MWKWKRIGLNGRTDAIKAYNEKRLQVVWSMNGEKRYMAKQFAKERGWKWPWFRFDRFFTEMTLESDANFQEVLYTLKTFELWEKIPD